MNTNNTNAINSPLFRSLGDIVDAPNLEPVEFWRGPMLFAGARVLLAGCRLTGKSDLALKMALAASTGGEFLGRKFERPIKVYLLQADIPGAFFEERIEKAMAHLNGSDLGLAASNLYFTGLEGLLLDRRPDWLKIKADLERIRPDLLIIDSIANSFSGDETNCGQVRTFLKLTEKLGEDLEKQPALIVVHNIEQRTDADEPFDSLDDDGSNVLRGWSDTSLLLATNKVTKTIHFECRNCEAPEPIVIEDNADR